MVETQVIESEKVRVPTPPAGCGYVITRYGEAKSVVLTPEDFDELNRASRLVAQVGRLTPVRRTAVETRIARASQDEDFDLATIDESDLIG